MTNHSYYIANIVFCFNESPIHADKIYGRQGNTRAVPGLIFPLQENTLLADILHELLLVTIPDRDIGLLVEDDPLPGDLQDLFQVHDIGLVDPLEMVGQALLQLLQADKGDDRLLLALDINPHVLAHALHVFYLLHVNAHDLMLAFHERILES